MGRNGLATINEFTLKHNELTPQNPILNPENPIPNPENPIPILGIVKKKKDMHEKF